jgi:hypothetical protein
MFPGNQRGKFSVIAAFLFASIAANGQIAAPVQKQKARLLPTLSATEVGASFLIWNEKMKVTKGAASANGYADYAGLAVGIERNWTRKRWLLGGSIAYAVGKASAGGFGSDIDFLDSLNRSWWAGQLSVFGNYKLNTTFRMGIGLFSRYRVADWAPMEPTLKVAQMTATQVSGQLILRWQVARKVTLMQAFTPLDLVGSTLWQWTAQLVL